MKSIICPNCQTHLSVGEDRDYCFCTNCGRKIKLSVRTTSASFHKKSDVSDKEVSEKENTQEALRKYTTWRRKAKKIMIAGGFIIMPPLLWLCFIPDAERVALTEPLSVIIGGPIFLGIPLYLALTRPLKNDEDVSSRVLFFFKLFGVNLLVLMATSLLLTAVSMCVYVIILLWLGKYR